MFLFPCVRLVLISLAEFFFSVFPELEAFVFVILVPSVRACVEPESPWAPLASLFLPCSLYLSGLFTRYDLTRGSGHYVFETSRAHGFGRIGSGRVLSGGFQTLADRVGSSLPAPTRPARLDPTSEQP